MMMMHKMYADVIIPLKFRDSVTYSVPEGMDGKIVPGSIVRVTVVGRSYSAIVIRLMQTPPIDPARIKPLQEIVAFPPVSGENMEFLRQVASYYMCSVGDAFRFAAPSTVKAVKKPGKSTGTGDTASEKKAGPLPVLSPEQAAAAGSIRTHFDAGRNVLLHGVTGSGKTEIYITLAAECLSRGLNVLYLVPEIALSRQIQSRLAACFGDRLMVYHSKQTAAHRREVYSRIAENARPAILLGLRSALFLPYRSLGLIIVDEEHDTSYKQTDQAPRYHGRDTALMLGRIQHCPVLLGSATPSFESLYNVSTGKLGYVPLLHRYFGGNDSTVTVVDMIRERRRNAVKGPFSLTLLKAIASRIEKGEQTLIFRSRRAYATALECPECGSVIRCPRCNISLSYHKFDNTVRCHYCGYTSQAPALCPECGKGPMKFLGDGTEKIEEELRNFFPEARIERFDADTTKDRKDETRILRQFSEGEIDILVGTQMISKGFDFSRLTLTAVLKAEAMTSLFDFRADERALQLLLQLMGRAGRRETPGEIIIQTNRAGHPVFQTIGNPEGNDIHRMMAERMEFGYPPYTRIIRLLVKSPEKDRLNALTERISRALQQAGFHDISGPAAPPVDRTAGEYLMQFIVKTDRTHNWSSAKERLYNLLRSIPAASLTIDVDPVN